MSRPKILRDPLVHFLALGAALFFMYELFSSDEPGYDSKVINVDRDALLTFVQYRTRAFDPQTAAARLDKMSEQELERLISEYVREEALYREAKALGLHKNDYVIKRRMIRSIEFITDGFVAAAVEVTDEDIAEHYAANREDYYVSPFVTFTHVFIDGERRGREEAYAIASTKLEQLNREQVPFNEAPAHGDRFPYLVNYVERDPEFVASHFGQVMAREVFQLEPSDDSWHGPFESEFGLHLIMLSKKEGGRYPELAEIEATVRDDALRAETAKQRDRAIQSVVDTYSVQRTYEHPDTSPDRE